MTSDIRVKIGLEGVQQVQAGAGAAAASLGQFGQSAARSGQQTAQLSAQVQDFLVQIQAGQSPLTAFIQQGSQLSAVFGGFGNAARAIGALITPAVAAIGTVAAGVGTLAFAYANGQREQEAFRRSIVLTGNAAGVTAGQLADLAKAQSSRPGGGSQSQNAEVLAQLVATGQVARSVLGQAAEAAVRLQREGGPAIKETVKAFEDLGRTPLDALKRLNVEQNFLTLTTYKQVRALQDQGKSAEAAAVAQQAFASAGISRTKELESQVGTVERAYRAAGRAASDFWQAVLNVGRPQSIADQVAAIDSQLAELERRRRPGGNERLPSTTAAGGPSRQLIDAQFGDLSAKRAALQEQARLLDTVAQNEAARAAAVKAGIKADDDAAEARKKATDELKRQAEAGRELVESLRLESQGLSGDYIKKTLELAAARRLGVISAEQMVDAQAKLLADQPREKEALKVAEEAARARAEFRAKEAQSIEAYFQQQEAEQSKALQTAQGRVQALKDEAAAVELSSRANISLAEAIEQVAISRLREKQTQFTDGSEPYLAIEREIAARRELLPLLAAKAAGDANKKAAEDALRDWERISDQVGQGLADALIQGGKSAADYLKSAFRALVLRPIIQAAVQPVAQSVLGLLGFAQPAAASTGGAAGAAGGVSTAANALQQIQQLQSLYSAGSKLYAYGAKLSAQYLGTGNTLAATSLENAAFLEANGVTVSGISTGSSAAAGSSSFVGSAGFYAAIAAGVYKANQDYSEGFNTRGARQVGRDTFGLSGTFEGLQAGLLTKLGFSDRLASLLSGSTAVAKIIGRADPKVTETGLEGSLRFGSSSTRLFQNSIAEGGLLRSDKGFTVYDDTGEVLTNSIDAQAAKVLAAATKYGSALGLPVDALGNVSTTIRATFTGKLEEDAATINALFEKYAEDIAAGFGDSLKSVAVFGETAAQTLERVGAELIGVNAVLKQIDLAALNASVSGGAAAVAISDLFGGLDSLTAAAATYYDRFFSDSEKVTRATDSLTTSLAGVGLALPESRDGFRDLVEGLDLTTASGQTAFAALLSVAGAFDELQTAADAIRASNLQGQLDDIERTFGDFSVLDASQTVSERLQEGRQAVQELQDGLAELLGQVPQTIQGVLADLLQKRAGFRTRIDDVQQNIDDARLGALSTPARIAALKQREQLFAALLPAADDQEALADRLQSTILQRIGLEAELTERVRQLTEDVAQFTGSLRSSDLSPLSFEQQLAASRNLFETTLAGAQAGDANAQQNLTGNARAFLEEARQFFGSSEQFAAIFAQVTGQLDGLGAGLDTGGAGSPSDGIAAQENLLTLLTAAQDAVQAKIDRQIELAENEIEAKQRENELREAELTVARENAIEIQRLLKLIAGNTGSVADSAGLDVLQGVPG